VFTVAAAAQAPTAANKPEAGTPAYHLPPAKLAQAIALSRIRLILHFSAEAWELAVLMLILATGRAARLGRWTEARNGKRWLQGAIFSAGLLTVLFALVDFPMSAIGHYYSLQYGISIEQWLAWLADEGKTLALTVAIETPVLMLLFGLLHWWPRTYWLWLAGSAVPMMLLGTLLLPTVVEPMFNTFEPLSKTHPALVGALEKVVERTGTHIPPERMFLMKASAKSNGLNAYVTGLGPSKRVVVWDTTADRIPQDETLFIFGHESGHYVLNHINKGLAIGAVGIFLLFGLAAKSAEWLVRRYGGCWQIPVLAGSSANLAGIAVLFFAAVALLTLSEPVQSTISRHFEHEADIYGQEAMHGILPNPQKTAVAAFNDLGEAYLDDPNPNPLIEFWSYDHPSLKNRAAFAAQYDPWAPGGMPQFFAK